MAKQHINIEEELLRIALIGTQRARLSNDVEEAIQQMGIKENLSPEDKILSAISILSKIKKAQFPLKKFAIPTAVPPSEKKVCSKASIQHLDTMINGAYEKALPEFLHHLALGQKCLPPEVLPSLLDQALTSPQLWSVLAPAIGERAQWLIQLNPDWRRLSPQASTTDWNHSIGQERLDILSRIRQENPPQALAMVKATWASENVKQRVQFIQILAQHLDAELADFLTTLLKDKSKLIRQASLQVIVQIPHHPFGQKIFKELTSIIKFQQSRLNIELPETIVEPVIPADMLAHLKWLKGGAKSKYLGQMMSLTAPQKWENHWGLSPKMILQYFAESEWAALCIQAIIEATILHKNQNWAAAILAFKLDNHQQSQWQNLATNPLTPLLSEQSFNHLAIQCLQKTIGTIEDHLTLIHLLKTSYFTWNDELTLLFITHFQNWLSSKKANYWNGGHYRTLLQKVAYLCSPRLLEQLKKHWPIEARIWSSWENEVEECIAIVAFRKNMIDSLTPT